MSTTLTIRGASDDLIELDGDISEEFGASYNNDQGDLLALSDGTVLRIVYSNSGVWRITPVARGTAELTIDQAPEGDDDRYTDIATLTGDIRWVVRGAEIAKR